MAKEQAWPRQPSDRQWEKPEGDDPRTLYQMLMVSQEMFGDAPCIGYIPAPGMARVHLSYNEFGGLATAVGKGTDETSVSKRATVLQSLSTTLLSGLHYPMVQTH